MFVALEIMIIPLLLLTYIMLKMTFEDLHPAVHFAGAIFVALLYAAVIRLLMFEREEERDASAPGEEDERHAKAASNGPPADPPAADL